MSMKQRVLMCLQTLESDLSKISKTYNKEMLVAVMQNMAITKNVCLQGLPSKNSATYEKIYDQMLLAAKEMGDSDRVKIKKYAFSQCMEHLKHLIHKTERETKFKKDIVFLPYSASMWDSLESVWKAACEDKEHCNAYVMPIPYCDRNPDGTPAKWRCEMDKFPKYVPTLDWREIDLKGWHPDVIFIHNPYDDSNCVTSVESSYYSRNLRPDTDLLIYSPYYVTSGGLGEGQRNCPAFPYLDYIIVQAESFRKLFHPSVPVEKLIPLGSPKLDRVVNLCNNPPTPPEEWREKLNGKKVYFYNTSLGGMLCDTTAFLNKMQYVFNTFVGRKDACLIWRPHPLMESTLSSMRGVALPYYEKLKEWFIKENIGIYDDTPDIGKTISLSDAYIGDSSTSVTMLFAIVGKPLFILENGIHELPKSEDWRGDFLGEVTFQEQDNWIVTASNQLYYAKCEGAAYRHVCSLCEYHSGNYYFKVIEIGKKAYVCPANAQDILRVSKNGIEERIPLERKIETAGAFAQALQADAGIFLIPLLYPAIVRYDTRTKELAYIKDMNRFFVKNIQGEWRVGGSCVWQRELLIASPNTAEVLRIDVETLDTKVETVGANNVGCFLMAVDGKDVWLLPSTGYALRKWNPSTGEVKEYSVEIAGIKCRHPIYQFDCDEFPFGQPAFDENYVYLPPCWGNKFVKIAKDTGAAEEWKIPLLSKPDKKNSYFRYANVAGFLRKTENDHWRMFYWPERKLYDVNVKTGECREVPIILDKDALRHEAVGFAEQAEWLRYGCQENAFHTLPALLDGTLPGNPHDKDRQLRAYRQVAANYDGTAGEKVYRFAMEKLSQKRGNV